MTQTEKHIWLIDTIRRGKDVEKAVQIFFEEKVKPFYGQYATAFADNGTPLLYYVFQTEKYYYNPDLLIVGINPGSNFYGEPQLAQKSNYYITGNDAWAACLRSAFGYGENEYLSSIFENCVGTNRVFLNTRRERDLEKKILPKAQGLLEELIQILQPKHIVALGMSPFNALRGKSKVELRKDLNFKLSNHKGVPLAYIPNPSGCCRRYYTVDKLCAWQNVLEKFMRDEL